jgi:hypothetical protein
MTEFVLDGFSCRAEGSGDVLVMLFSGSGEFFSFPPRLRNILPLSGCSRWNSSQPGNHVDPEQLAAPQSRGSSQSASA